MKWLIVLTISIIFSSLFFIQNSESASSNSTCTDNDDCKTSGEYCIRGACKNLKDLVIRRPMPKQSIQNTTSVSCKTNSNCASGKSCVNGTCTLVRKQIPVKNLTTIQKTTSTSCKTDSNCTRGKSCVNGTCVLTRRPFPKTTISNITRNGSCITNSDCKTGQICSNKVCVASRLTVRPKINITKTSSSNTTTSNTSTLPPSGPGRGISTRYPIECGEEIFQDVILNEDDPVTRGVCSRHGLRASVNNIVIDCNGFTIRGRSFDDTGYYTYGIILSETSGVTVKNCHFEGFETGIQASSAANANIQDNYFIGLKSYAFLLRDSRNINITSNVIHKNEGIYYENTSDTWVLNNHFSGNLSYLSASTIAIHGENNNVNQNDFLGSGVIHDNGDVLSYCENYFGPDVPASSIKLGDCRAVRLTPWTDNNPCLSSSECVSGQVCRSNECILSTEPPRCESDSDCEAGGQCRISRCSNVPLNTICERDQNCGNNRICVGDRCSSIEDHPGLLCDDNSDCSENQTCQSESVGNRCVANPTSVVPQDRAGIIKNLFNIIFNRVRNESLADAKLRVITNSNIFRNIVCLLGLCEIDTDADDDGIENADDNCRNAVNLDQMDSDGDGKGNVCDTTPFPSEVVCTVEGAFGDPCGIIEICHEGQCLNLWEYTEATLDSDGDGVFDNEDNCKRVSNADQADTDGDGLGDACDFSDEEDGDRDGILDDNDNCPDDPNANQRDLDRDGRGDVCDQDRDGDIIINNNDNCPDRANPNQLDSDGDGIGNVCDTTPLPVDEPDCVVDVDCSAGQVCRDGDCVEDDDTIDFNTTSVTLFASPEGVGRRLLIINDLIPDAINPGDASGTIHPNNIIHVRINTTEAGLGSQSSEQLNTRVTNDCEVFGLDREVIPPDNSKVTVDPRTLHDPATPEDYEGIYDPSYQFFGAPGPNYYVKITVGWWNYDTLDGCYKHIATSFVNDCGLTAFTQFKEFTLPINDQDENTTFSIKISEYIPDGGFASVEEGMCEIWG